MPRKASRSDVWWDEPSSYGKSPRRILENLAADLSISRGDIFTILTVASTLKDRRAFPGVNSVRVVLACAYLYIRCPTGGRPPISSAKFVKICRKELRISDSYLLMLSRQIRQLGFFKESPTPEQVVERMWRKLNDHGLPESCKTAIVNTIEDARKKGHVVGKRPNVVAASCTWIACKNLALLITQPFLANLFGVSDMSIRNFAKKLDKL